jgi:hypothetical protein
MPAFTAIPSFKIKNIYIFKIKPVRQKSIKARLERDGFPADSPAFAEFS